MNFETFYTESIIDLTRNGLDPTVFILSDEAQPILLPAIKMQIMDNLMNFRRNLQINKAYIIGSILGRNYSKNSDIDVTIEVNREDIDEDTGVMGIEKITQILRSINGSLATGTTHPINYYITVDFNEDDADAIYDIEQDKWLKEPSGDGSINLNDYVNSFQDMVANVDLTTGQLKRDVIDYAELKDMDNYSVANLHTMLSKKLYEINKHVENLVHFKDTLKTKRREAFARPMDPQEIVKYASKNKLPANVVYKLFQKYYYFDLIQKLDEIISNRDKGNEYVDDIEDLLGYKESISFEEFIVLEEVFGKKFKAGVVDWKNPTAIKKYRNKRYQMRRGLTGSQSLHQVPDIHKSHRALGLAQKVVAVAKKAPAGIWRLTPMQVRELSMKYHHIPPNKRNPIKHLGNTGIVVWRKAPNLYYLVKHRNFG